MKFQKPLIALWTCLILATMNYGCKSTEARYRPKKSQYHTSSNKLKRKNINDIQYEGAYKYDTDGKKFKKHFRKKSRRKEL